MAVIRGTVVDGTGRPVAGAAVYLVSSPAAHADIALQTGADGAFALAAPAAGAYVLGARSDDAGEGQATVIVGGAAGGDVEARITLTRSA